jgi:transcription termination factor Rho
MSRGGLSNLHIAGLHERAAQLDVPDYRRLRREELIAAIEAAGGDAPSADEKAAPKADTAATPPRRRRRPARARLDEETDGDKEGEEAPEESEPVSGVLDLTGQGHGFLRLAGLERGEDDIYVSASQIRRCELRVGDQVSGPARPPRRGERHRALVHVDKVNGAEPTDKRPDFESLTPVTPTRRLPLETDDVLVRAANLLAPLAFGQRVLVAAAPRSGRTTLLRGLASALAGSEGAELVVLLIDERPEEATAWREALPDTELAIATADMSPAEQLRVAEIALERARRRAESGADLVLICDSLSRLAAAARDAAPVKRLFGSGRQLDGEGAGSLTVIATTLAEDDDASQAVATTENALITLSPKLAAAGITPALDASRTRASDEDKLLSEEGLAELRELRAELDGLEPAAAAERLRERLEVK